MENSPTSSPSGSSGPEGEVVNSASQRRELGLAGDIEDKDNYDAMLHRDTRYIAIKASVKLR